MSNMASVMYLATSSKGYAVPTFTGSQASSLNYNDTSGSGTYGIRVDICSTNANAIILSTMRGGGSNDSKTITLSMPSGFDRTKFNYSIINLSNLGGFSLTGNATGVLTTGSVVTYQTSYGTSSINRIMGLTVRLSRVENSAFYVDIPVTAQFIKNTYVNPEPAMGGSTTINPLYIQSLGGQANMSITFQADRYYAARGIWVDTDSDVSTGGGWLNSNYNVSNYEARMLGDNGSWTQLPGTVNWSSDGATASGSNSVSTRIIEVRNKTTMSIANFSVGAVIIGPNATALVYPALTFPTSALDNAGWSWSFALHSNGTYSTTYSTASNQEGSFTATGRWLKEGYAASNYRFTNVSGGVTPNGAGMLTGTVFGIGNVSTRGASFSAGGSTGVRASGRFGVANMSIRIENLTLGSVVANPGVALTIDKNIIS